MEALRLPPLNIMNKKNYAKALVMGSFDPITLGHVYLINQALALVEDVCVCVMINDAKLPRFTIEQRVDMINIAMSGSGITVDSYAGMCYEYCKEHGIDIIIRGYRNDDDLAYEREMAAYNKTHCGVETMLIMADEMHRELSSSLAMKDSSAASDILPQGVQDYINSIK